MPYIITAHHTISSNPRNVVPKKHFIREIIFTVLVLVSSLLTSVAGIVALYETKEGGCRPRTKTAVLVLECIAFFLSVIVYIIGFSDKFKESNRTLHVRRIAFLNINITSNTPQINAILIGWTLFTVNGICLAMAIVIFVNDGCGNVIDNGVYNGAAIIGSFLIVLLSSFPIERNLQKQAGYQTQNSRGVTLNHYWMQTQQKERRENPVRN
jgi:hypothetical protein